MNFTVMSYELAQSEIRGRTQTPEGAEGKATVTKRREVRALPLGTGLARPSDGTRGPAGHGRRPRQDRRGQLPDAVRDLPRLPTSRDNREGRPGTPIVSATLTAWEVGDKESREQLAKGIKKTFDTSEQAIQWLKTPPLPTVKPRRGSHLLVVCECCGSREATSECGCKKLLCQACAMVEPHLHHFSLRRL